MIIPMTMLRTSPWLSVSPQPPSSGSGSAPSWHMFCRASSRGSDWPSPAWPSPWASSWSRSGRGSLPTPGRQAFLDHARCRSPHPRGHVPTTPPLESAGGGATIPRGGGRPAGGDSTFRRSPEEWGVPSTAGSSTLSGWSSQDVPTHPRITPHLRECSLYVHYHSHRSSPTESSSAGCAHSPGRDARGRPSSPDGVCWGRAVQTSWMRSSSGRVGRASTRTRIMLYHTPSSFH